MTHRIMRMVLLCVLGVLVATTSSWAQTGQNFGEIVGKVVDQQGGVLPGVLVTLSGPSIMGAPTATTNEHGLYRFGRTRRLRRDVRDLPVRPAGS